MCQATLFLGVHTGNFLQYKNRQTRHTGQRKSHLILERLHHPVYSHMVILPTRTMQKHRQTRYTEQRKSHLILERLHHPVYSYMVILPTRTMQKERPTGPRNRMDSWNKKSLDPDVKGTRSFPTVQSSAQRSNRLRCRPAPSFHQLHYS